MVIGARYRTTAITVCTPVEFARRCSPSLVDSIGGYPARSRTGTGGVVPTTPWRAGDCRATPSEIATNAMPPAIATSLLLRPPCERDERGGEDDAVENSVPD